SNPCRRDPPNSKNPTRRNRSLKMWSSPPNRLTCWCWGIELIGKLLTAKYAKYAKTKQKCRATAWSTGVFSNCKSSPYFAWLAVPQTSLHVSVSAFLGHDSFNLSFRIVTKIYKEPQLESRCFEVILNLGAVLVCEFCYRFEFQHDLVVTNEVRLVLRTQETAFVFQREWFLWNERDSLQSEFDLH